MRTEIKALHQSLKTTSVYVTHDQIETMTMGDKIVVMRDGFVEQIGSPLELYDRPANVFVAGFIGSPAMNMLPGTMRHDGAGSCVELRDGALIEVSPNKIGAEGQRVLFGTRPEHLHLVEGSYGGISVKVEVVEPTGADTYVACRHADAAVSVVFHQRQDLNPGSVIYLQPDMAQVHVFDLQTGANLLRR